MKYLIKIFICAMIGILVLTQCTSHHTSHNFVIATDSCFKNPFQPDTNILVGIGQEHFGYQHPLIYTINSRPLIHMPGTNYTIDSVSYLSPDKQVQTTNWITRVHPVNGKRFSEHIYSQEDFASFNDYVVQQHMFSQDTTLKIIKNVMYDKCQYPHFVIQGETKDSIYFIKSENSHLPIVDHKMFKNYLLILRKSAKSKYWGTVHQMIEDFHYYQVDTTKILKRLLYKLEIKEKKKRKKE